jgi:hypothetical protein
LAKQKGSKEDTLGLKAVLENQYQRREKRHHGTVTFPSENTDVSVSLEKKKGASQSDASRFLIFFPRFDRLSSRLLSSLGLRKAVPLPPFECQNLTYHPTSP